MTRSPLFNLIIGSVFGGLIAMTLTLHVVTSQVQARNAQITDRLQKSSQDRAQSEKELYENAQKVIDAWQQRAEKCEVKERYATVIYEYRPGAALPLLHGAFAITLGSVGNHPDSDLKPVWVIPVQTPVYTNLPGASYEWVDGKTGATIGRFPAVPPPSESVPQ